MSKTPEPQWKPIESDGNIQIRQYEPTIIAEVIVTGERSKAINDGFRILADYIFGQNKSNIKIPMTAPVTQEKDRLLNQWRVRFVMPASYTLNTLPQPNDIRINLIEVPPHRSVAIRFSGFSSSKNIETNEAKLMAWVLKRGIKTKDQPLYAFYNPPWILPFLRRNEIIIDIVDENK